MAKKTRLNVQSNTVYSKKYDKFKGVDFSHEASLVDDEHSPYAQNMIAATDGLPEKRVGWRSIIDCGARINGIYSFGKEENRCKVIHAGNKIYKLSDGELQELIGNIADKKSSGKYFKGKLCILTGEEYLVFDGETCIRAGECDNIYAPITLVSRQVMTVASDYLNDNSNFKKWTETGVMNDRDGTALKAGTVLDGSAVNLISGRRKNCFEYRAASGVQVFILDESIDKGSKVIMRYIATGEVIFELQLQPDRDSTSRLLTDEDGKEDSRLQIMTMLGSHTRYNVRIENNSLRNVGIVQVSLNTSKIASFSHIDGVDDFSIEYTHVIPNYSEKIDKCTIMDIYENRLFFSGNPDFPNADWCSGVNDPLYVPDMNYTEIGMNSSRIMGYLRTGSEQAILKNDGNEATIYMRSCETLPDGKVIFPVRQGISGIGAISEKAICTLLDDPLYLSGNGVYAISMQDIWKERSLNARSTYINKRLINENGLENAMMCEWRGLLILCVGGCAYVADASQKQYIKNVTNTFEYVWYYWTNIPARVLFEDNGELYFGTESGFLCKFNSDLEGAERFSDNGEAIVAEWATNLSDDGNFMQEKTLIKTGSGIRLKGEDSTDITVIIRRDNGEEETLSLSGDYILPLNTRVKKYRALQLICRHDRGQEGFGICGIQRRFFYGKIKK